MRRRSERTKSISSPVPAERTRRSSRRTKKTISKSPEREESVDDTGNQEGIEKQCDTSSDAGSEQRSNITSLEEKTLPKRRRAGKSENVSSIPEENGELIQQPTKEDETATMENEKSAPDNNANPVLAEDNDNSNVKITNNEPSENVLQENSVNSETVATDTNIENDQTCNADLKTQSSPNDSKADIDAENNESSPKLDKEHQEEDSGEHVNNNQHEESTNSSESSRFKGSNDVQESRWDVETVNKKFNLEDKLSEKKLKGDQILKDDEFVDQEGKENLRSRKTENSELIDNDLKNKKPQPVKKRKWLTRKDSESKPKVLAISTDSLKNLISDVEPVPLSDVKLESSSEPEENNEMTEKAEKESRRYKERKTRENDSRRDERSLSSNRKISVINITDDSKSLQKAPSPPKNESCNILYITNLVRPFTVLQLKGLLARTGKIVENGFWMDKIKSQCYVKYETEDQAIETRHALHGVRWPTSNPKCLNVDFGSKAAMEKAIASQSTDSSRFQVENSKDNRIVGTGWDKERLDFEEQKDQEVNKPIREWDLGKKEELEREMERTREKQRGKDRDKDRRRRSVDRDDKSRRRSSSGSPARKFKKTENDPPLRLLDDLFRKTKTTPCIYWLPLTPEQIAEKEEIRRKRMEEHEMFRKEKEKERERDRERERNKDRRRERSNERRSSRSRDRRRY